MNAFLLFLSSLVIIFAFAFQQHNVQLGTAATAPEMAAFLIGGPLGTLAAMWLNDRLFIAANTAPQ